MKKVVNEYVFDYPMLKKFYKLNLQTKFYLVLLLLVLLSTISSFLDNDISFGVFSLVVFLLGCIYYFLFPSILAKTASKDLVIKITEKMFMLKYLLIQRKSLLKTRN